MKGRNSFSQEEIKRIRELLRQKTSSSAQKAIRAQIRSLGFYISDFGARDTGFTESDLDRLIASGAVSIRGEAGVSLRQRLRVWWSARRR